MGVIDGNRLTVYCQMALKQPISQVRLTNVAVVKHRSHGKRFEVACFKNKVLNWRAGTESNLDEVVQSRTIFQNVSKGQLAKHEDIVAVFGTADVDVICRIILEKGEIQVSEKERQVVQDAIFRDVCTFASERCINGKTGLPLTVSMVHGALKDAGFSIKIGESAKRQALKAIDLLCKEMPELVVRSQMRIRISSTKSQSGILKKFLIETCSAEIEEEDPSQEITCSTTRSVAIEETYSVTFLCDPSQYRPIDEFVAQVLQPAGNLLLLSSGVSAIKVARSVPVLESNIQSSTPQSVAGPGIQSTTSDTLSPTKVNVHQTTGGRLIRCGCCLVELDGPVSYRKHCQSEWHGFNLKRKVKNLDAVSEQEFDDINRDIRDGFLAVDS